MFGHSFLSILAFVGLSVAVAHAQERDATVPVEVRAVLHDPIHPVANLFYTDKTGTVFPLNFRPQALTEALIMQAVNGVLVLYDKAEVDPKKPEESMAASVKVSPDLKRAICVVMPAPAGEKPAYRLLMIDDSEKAFAKGESRVLSLTNVETAIQAGEHKLPVHPGKITRVPAVSKVDDFHMAQTNFYYQQGGSWVAFAERQLQYVDVCRRLFIVHVTPGALVPTVTTIVDTARVGAVR